jgi:hypothetical protein
MTAAAANLEPNTTIAIHRKGRSCSQSAMIPLMFGPDLA